MASLSSDSGSQATGEAPAQCQLEWHESSGTDIDEYDAAVQQDLSPEEESAFHKRLMAAAAAEGEAFCFPQDAPKKDSIQFPIQSPNRTQTPPRLDHYIMRPQPGPPEEPDGNSPRRFRRACDACSRRKVRCHNVRPCRNCIDLGIECTTDRLPKRRGPPSRVTEDLKRQRVNQLVHLRSPPDTPQVSPRAIPLPTFNLDAIAPPELILQMTYEFFTFVYPIFPFPHEHITMQRLRGREDIGDSKFCALIASMLAVVALMSPCVVETAAKRYGSDPQQAYDSFIARCQELCEQTKKPLKTGRVDVYDAATAFFQALTCKLQRRHGINLYTAEALAILIDNGLRGEEKQDNIIVRELQSRLFWSIYSFVRMSEQTPHRKGSQFPQPIHDIIPPCPLEDLPQPPTQVDDYYIYADAIRPAPEGSPSLIDAFNKTIEIYKSYRRLPRYNQNADEAEDPHSDRSDKRQSPLAAHLDAILSNDLRLALEEATPQLREPPDPLILETPAGPAMQQARPRVRLHIQNVVFRAALIQTRWHLTQQAAHLHLSPDGTSAQPALQEARRLCLSELTVLLDALTPRAVRSLTAYLGPGLWGVVRGLQTQGGDGVEWRREVEAVERKMRVIFGEQVRDGAGS